MKLALFVLLLVLLPRLHADSGTLIPRDHQAPDPAILSLEEMRVDIVIDNGDAHVKIVQIFANHTANIEEGTYRFALPSAATVSDFAVWDGPVRIPAVILERRRAEEIYDQARLQAIDPGLLEAGEQDHRDPRATSLFTAKIVPIPAWGTKRLELEYHQRLATSQRAQAFVLTLKPDAGQQQLAQHFALHFTLHSAHAFEPFTPAAASIPLTLTTRQPHNVEGTFEASHFNFTDDFHAGWKLAAAPANDPAEPLTVITHRDPHPSLPTAGEASNTPRPHQPEPGFFEAQWLLPESPPATPPAAPIPRTVILLFDTSLSMQWDKLERSYAALEATLHSLAPTDRFNLVLFNQGTTLFAPQPVLASVAATHQALDFVRAAPLSGGTDLLKALTAALAQSSAPATTLVLITDGGSDRGETVLPGKIAARYTALWKRSPHPPHTAVFAVGDDADLPLLRSLAANSGFLEPVLSTESIDFHLQSFLARLTLTPVTGLTLAAPSTSLVYQLDDAVYPGSIAQWVGQYHPGSKPGDKPVPFTAGAAQQGSPLRAAASTALPANDLTHPQLPRLWAQARVNALLAQVDRDGETAAALDEIIRLSRRYKFVTPYTSFLAVPRSLLRPRVIRPGDPVLRVHTDAAITSVIALFPFGLTKPLRHLAGEDSHAPGTLADRLWETRFLAPPGMKDGTYAVRLILRDTHGNTYREARTFVIASTPPTVALDHPPARLHPGQSVELHARASASTRTLTAHLAGVSPVSLRWDTRTLTNAGTLALPAGLPIGRYTLTVTAEDIAHNLGSQEVQVDVIP